jgi:hypothetical protein
MQQLPLFQHSRPSNAYQGMKILQSEIIRTQTSFSTSFCGRLSFHLVFLFSYAPPLVLHVFSLLLLVQLGKIITLKPCALHVKFQHFIMGFHFKNSLCEYH